MNAVASAWMPWKEARRCGRWIKPSWHSSRAASCFVTSIPAKHARSDLRSHVQEPFVQTPADGLNRRGNQDQARKGQHPIQWTLFNQLISGPVSHGEDESNIRPL